MVNTKININVNDVDAYIGVENIYSFDSSVVMQYRKGRYIARLVSRINIRSCYSHFGCYFTCWYSIWIIRT